MPANDFPFIRRLLEAAIDQAIRDGAGVIDADAAIAQLAQHFPNGLPFGETELRSEVLDLAKRCGLVVKMGGAGPHKQ